MITQCIAVACILGMRPLIEKHILKYIRIDSFLVISAILFFLMAILYTLLVHAPHLAKDLQIMNQHVHLYPTVLLFIFLFYITANYLYLHMINLHNPSHVTSIIAIYPLITVILAFLFLDDDITLTQFLGGIITIAGITMLAYHK